MKPFPSLFAQNSPDESAGETAENAKDTAGDAAGEVNSFIEGLRPRLEEGGAWSQARPTHRRVVC